MSAKNLWGKCYAKMHGGGMHRKDQHLTLQARSPWGFLRHPNKTKRQ